MRVSRLLPRPGYVTAVTSAGEIDARQVIVATEAPTASDLTGEALSRGALSSTYLYYATPQRVSGQHRLLLNAETGLINNAQWTSLAVPGRAPAGQHLLTVTVLRLLMLERLPYAQFEQPAGYAATLPGHATSLPGVLIASEITSMSGIQGALESGEKAAAIVLGDLAALSRPRGA